jgi:hypothetical protein
LKISLAFLAATYILISPSTSPGIGGKTAEIKNAAWQKVPDTEGTESGYTDAAFIDINGITRNSALVVFDVVNPDAGYSRVEANCQTNQFRTLRLGIFLTPTRVSFIEQSDLSWLTANSYQSKLLKFACNTSSQKDLNSKLRILYFKAVF